MRRALRGKTCTLLFLMVAPLAARADFEAELEGQSFSQSDWHTGTIHNWKEREGVPCRIRFRDGPASNVTITLEFDHTEGRIVAIEDLNSFSRHDVVITDGPTLSAPVGSDVWSYTFTVDVRDSDAELRFEARLAAGAHLANSSSFQIRGSGDLGVLEIERPERAVGNPDLVVNKTGPATAAAGEVLTYHLECYNKAEAENAADGVQVIDFLPEEVSFVQGSANWPAVLVGNTLRFDLGDLQEGERETVTYQVRVNDNVPPRREFANFVQIFSSEDDADPSDNWSWVSTINNVNTAPAAQDDFFTLNEDTPLEIASPGLLENDIDAEGNTLTALLAIAPEHGELTLRADGSFSYVPHANFHGMDTFTYLASDGSSNSLPAMVILGISPLNDLPEASDDSYAITEDSVLDTARPGVLANDRDIEGDALLAKLATPPAHGTVQLMADGSFSYFPNPQFSGVDTFTYHANDGTADSDPATVRITVLGVNDGPVANADTYTTDEDRALEIAAPGVLNNDQDAEDDLLRAVLLALPAHGVLNLNSDGSFLYTPDPNYSGADQFTYRAYDAFYGSAAATVTISVRPVNDAPAARDDFFAAENHQTIRPAAPGVLGNDTDLEQDGLRAILVSRPDHGSLTLNADGSFTYVPDPKYSGLDKFTYKASDGAAESGIATVTIAVNLRNDAPVARNDNYAVAEDDSLHIAAPGVLNNDTDADGDSLAALLIIPPLHGALTLQSDGSFAYTPYLNYHGLDHFTYQANDGAAESGIATVTLTVTPVNDPPVGVDDNYVTAQKCPVTLDAPGVLANDTDVDGDLLQAVLVSGPSHGTITLNADGSFSYNPDPLYHGSDSFTYKAHDGTAESGVVTVSITVSPLPVENVPPVVTMVAPTNGSIFIAPATFSVVADGLDVGGCILIMEIFQEDTLLAKLLAAPYFTVVSNLPVGQYSFHARGTDNQDAVSISSTVTVSVIEAPPVTTAVPMHFNPQTGLFEMVARVRNPTPQPFGAVRVLASNLPAHCRLYNKSGETNGVAFVQSNNPLPPGQTVDLMLEFYTPDRSVPNPTLAAKVVQPVSNPNPIGLKLPLRRVMKLADGTMLLDWNSAPNRIYYVQYTDDMVTWKTAMPSVRGTGTTLQWLDNGPPKTDSMPLERASRFYRVILLP